MERLKCKACSCYSMVPMEVSLESEEDLDPSAESKFYTCHVCGDNWLSVREEEDTGDSRVTFVHQMGMSPLLKRVAHMQKHMVLKETTIQKWEYFFDDEAIEETKWQEKLANRRKVLKSICTN